MASRNPIISIIIPIYNISEYIIPCVKSVLAQDILKEIILVDDGSTDGSEKICDRLAEENDCIRVIHKKNGGLSDARNMGLAAATGDFVYFLDGDDRVLHRTLINAVRDANRFEADVVVGGIHTVKSNQTLDEWDKTAYETFRHDRTYTGAEYIKGMLPACDFRVEIGRYVYRRDFLLNTGLQFPLRYHEDEYFTPRLLLLCDRLFVADYQMYDYNNSRDGSIMHMRDPEKRKKRAADCEKIYGDLVNLYKLCPDKDLREKLLDNAAWKYLAVVENLPCDETSGDSAWRWNLIRYASTPRRKTKAFAYSVSPKLYRKIFGTRAKNEIRQQEG